MIKRKLVYGYQIVNGEVVLQPAESPIVVRVFRLYQEGLSYQKISDQLNQEKLPYSAEGQIWDKHKIKRLLENPRYIGEQGFPPIVDRALFQEIQARIQGKTQKATERPVRPVLAFKRYLRCAHCAGRLLGLGGAGQSKDTLYLKCEGCGRVIRILDEDFLHEVYRLAKDRHLASKAQYTPSEEVVRLTNAINRGLEQPGDPFQVIDQILQGISARYDCCPVNMPQEQAGGPDLRGIDRMVEHITISQDNRIEIQFKEGSLCQKKHEGSG